MTNRERIQAAMLDTDAALEPFDRLWRRQLEQAQQAAERQHRMPERQRAAQQGQTGKGEEAPPVVVVEPNRREGPESGPPEQPSPFRGPTYPWYWAAGILVGLFGFSVWILSLRIKTLDRLK